MAEYLMGHFDTLERMIKSHRISLFLDYDGTLVPIAERPEKANLSPDVKSLLKKLKRCCPVAIISGRSLIDIRERVGISGIAYAGNHGMEIWSGNFSLKINNAVRLKKTLKGITEKLGMALGSVKGVVIENKGLTASIHYRMADKNAVGDMLKTAKDILLPYMKHSCLTSRPIPLPVGERAGGSFQVKDSLFILTKGKKVLEVRPNVLWNKGKAMHWMRKQNGFKGTLPVYIGDDKTDEDAFAAIKGNGLSIAVGHRLKGADYFLKSPGDVRKLLERMEVLYGISYG